MILSLWEDTTCLILSQKGNVVIKMIIVINSLGLWEIEIKHKYDINFYSADNHIYRTKGGPIISVDNTMVVPYNKFLLMKYKCHINVEYCASIHSIKYMFDSNKHVCVSSFELKSPKAAAGIPSNSLLNRAFKINEKH